MLSTKPFTWVNDTTYGAFTLTIVQGLTEDEVIERYGGDPAASEVMTFEDSFNWCDGDSPCYVRTMTVMSGIRVDGQSVTTDTAVVAIENNGWSGRDVARTSTSGRLFSVYLGGNGHTGIVHVDNGTLLADFEPTLMAAGGDPNGIAPPWSSLIEWTPDTIMPACLALASHVMGVHVREEWFTLPHRTARVPAP